MAKDYARKLRTLLLGTMLGLAAAASLATPSQAETGLVSLIITKGGLIVGIGGGEGTLSFHGHLYRFRVSGMSVGATIGASTSRFTGHALNMHAPSDIAGSYSAIGAGGAYVVGVGGVRLQNEKGVILQLRGGKVGLELSASVGGIVVTME